MEGIAPPLALLLSVKKAMEKGQSVRQGVLHYIKKDSDPFAGTVTQWLALLQQGQDAQNFLKSVESVHRRTLLLVLERGLRGESIHAVLNRLEEEIIEACREEMAERLAQLPFILLVPLLLFQFPAFLLLLFGPLLNNFFHSLGGG